MDVDANKFIEKIIQNEMLFMLSAGDTIACFRLDGDEQTPRVLFWTNLEVVTNIQKLEFENYKIIEITIFDFIYQWLPSVFNDAGLVAIDWDDPANDPLCYNPECLQEEITKRIPEDMLMLYDEKARNFLEQNYVTLGSFSNSDGRKLIETFNENGMRFDVASDSSAIKELEPAQAALVGGTYGHGSFMIFRVHEDDLSKAQILAKRG